VCHGRKRGEEDINVLENLISQVQHIGFLVPCVAIGAWLGNVLHHKVNQAHFTRIVFITLLVVGFLLLGKTGYALIV